MVLVAGVFLCRMAVASEELKKLEHTALSFRNLAERKAILAAAEKDPSKKAALLELADLLDQSADTTQKKADEERLLSVDPEVLSTRAALAAAHTRFKAAQDAVDRSRRSLAVAANPKQNAENAELYMKCMSDYKATDESLALATRRKDAAERAALSSK